VEKSASIGRRAARYSIGSLLSRVTGLIREVVTAACFGANPSIGAFIVAYRFSHVLRRLFGEGGLINGFVPHFEQHRMESEEKAKSFFRDLCGTIAFMVVGVIFLGELGLLIGSFWASPGALEVIKLSMIMLPGLFFIILWALFGALHQCEGNFFLPGASPAVFNGIWIAAALFAAQFPIEKGVIILGIGTVGAFFFQLLTLSPLPLRLLKHSGRARLFSREILHLLKALSYTVIGVGATQINNFLDMLFARTASLEGPAHLAYAIRLEQFPLALIPIALSTALLPTLSREADPKEKIGSSLNRVYLFLLPCTLAIFTMGSVIVNAVYGHGRFDVNAVAITTSALWGYGAGLIPMGFTIILSQSYFARKDFKTPMFASIQAVALNLILNTIFIHGMNMGAESVAWATSIASVYNMLYLMRGHHVMRKGLLLATTFGAISSLLTWFVVQNTLDAGRVRNVTQQLMHLAVFSSIFLLVYFFPLFLLHRRRQI
jgi:putative peptidoglycan lipid II flippase